MAKNWDILAIHYNIAKTTTKDHFYRRINKRIFLNLSNHSVVGHDRVTVMTQLLNWVMTETGHDPIQKFGSRPYWVMTRARVMTEFLKIYN
jgi:hypothetical protein